MSDTNKARLDDPRLDADLARNADPDKPDPKPARLGPEPVPDAGETIERETAEAGAAPSRSSVEGVDEAAAQRDSLIDSTR
ncbi:hypothetical protein GCM10011390_40420 [Aureimonas endophytica]|uniref:Uncharacterized protein n=1 Tax=Aureimonas endophytica TaxID=2027858 RepID=A0A917EAX5_9HYPH|nr:hypothetical protein [Aureimonas endophytica]GGE17226.1 hypothetical protein GCM10011390_40420 [Aureimonas endophytica]